MRKHKDHLGGKLDDAYLSQGHYGVINMLPNAKGYCLKYMTNIPTEDLVSMIDDMEPNEIISLVTYLITKYDERFNDPYDRQMIGQISDIEAERTRIIAKLNV
jgi:hypothetical protein